MLSRLNKKTLIIILTVVDVLLILLTLFIVSRQSERVKRLYSEQAAERWENEDMKYSEVSVFYSANHKTDVKTVEEIRNNLMKKLSDDSYLDTTTASETRLFIDAYSGFTEMSVEKDDNRVTGKIYGVNDDFFLVHPIPLLNGNYMNPVEKTNLIGDGRDPFQIVLDENMAWNLFGSVDVTGMKVWLNGKVFTVMGVVEASQNKTEEMAYGNYDAAYIPYKACEIMKLEVSINCYEAVLPNPIKNYAYFALSEAVGLNTDFEDNSSENANVRSTLSFGEVEVIENTGRFDMIPLFRYLKSKKYMSMKTTEIAYPYWENVARFEVERASGILKLCIGLLILPALTLIGLLIWLYSKRSVVFNSKNKEKAIGILRELGAGIKEHFTKPKKEDYDDDPEDDDDEIEVESAASLYVANSGVSANRYNGRQNANYAGAQNAINAETQNVNYAGTQNAINAGNSVDNVSGSINVDITDNTSDDHAAGPADNSRE